MHAPAPPSASAPARAPVTVVIPTYNNAGTIARTVAACVDQAEEVLVVDDGSTDGTQDAARAAGATVVGVSGRSAGHARNVGWERATHDVVLFTDSDAVPAPGWAVALRRALDADPSIDIVGGPIGLLGAEEAGRFARVYHRMYETIDGRMFHDGSPYFPGMNLGVRRSLRERVRFRDELPGAQCEDVDMLMRALALGVRSRSVPEAIVLHEQPGSLAALVEQELRHGEGRARLVALHPELRRFWQTDAWWKWIAMSTLGAPIHVVWALRHAKRLDLPLVAMHVLRMAIGDRGYLEGSRKLRRRDRSTRFAPPQ